MISAKVPDRVKKGSVESGDAQLEEGTGQR